jgi:hypothetical protein
MRPDELLRKASTAVQSGRLPTDAPHRTWGGFGIGAPCAVCEVIITPADAELEVEFIENGTTSDASTFHVHPCCFTAWDAERTQERD